MSDANTDDGQSAPLGFRVRAIANGVEDTNGHKLRATLVVSPIVCASDKSESALEGDLSNWPSTITKRLHSRQFLIQVRKSPPKSNGEVDTQASFAFLVPKELDLADVDALWSQAIQTGGGNIWAQLLKAIDASGSGKKIHTDSIKGVYSGKPIDAKAMLSSQGAIVADAHGPTDAIAVQAVVDIPHTSYARDTEAARAQRVVCKYVEGPYLPGDEAADDAKLNATPSDEPSEFLASMGDEERKKELQDRQDAVAAAFAKELNDAINDQAVQAARKKAFDAYNAAGDAIKATPAGGVCKDVGAAAASAPASALASMNAVRGDPSNSAKSNKRSAHVYGGWPQTGGRPGGIAESAADAPGLAHAQSAYYALQGDPLLARLFGFVFDISIVLPDGWIKEGEADSCLNLWLGTKVESGDDAEIWTAASLELKPGRFWPAPRFGSIGDPALPAEQMQGVFRLGEGYDLTSLEVRGALSGAPSGVDQGAPHHAMGWTLLDSNRASRVARDLAISTHQSEGRDQKRPVVLFAEELTIGRRLDVAVLNPSSGLDWRSLMTRFVRFENISDAARRRLRAVTAAFVRPETGSRLVDEASFQLVARSLPTPGGDKAGGVTPAEAVVDEAFQSWNGASLAVLACRSDANASKSDPMLNFQRVYELPTAAAGPHLRLPPLRFGVAYAFSMRAVFLGGGSPSVLETASHHQSSNFADVLPAGDKDGLKGRRFLRHEAVGAPVLLMIDTDATTLHGEMGFEGSGLAVVRTGTPAPADNIDDGDEAAPHSPPYISVQMRAQPSEARRVLIPPMAGMEFCARHRAFDQNPHKALAGGLLNVDFDAERRLFPTGVVRRNQGFNGDNLIYRREVKWSPGEGEEADTTDAAIFRVQAKEATRSNGKAYLPDPAAQTMSLRLRVVDTDVYLKDSVLIDLYDNGAAAYPDVLPVVIEVTRRSQRAAPAASANEVIFPDAKIRRLGPNGEFGGTGQRVLSVEIRLAPGEQFDLETVCLPTKARLADWFALVENIGVQSLLAARDAAFAQKLADICSPATFSDFIAAVGGSQDGRLVGLAGYPIPDSDARRRIADLLLKRIRSAWPITEIAGVTKLRVAHATNIPAVKPELCGISIVRIEDAAAPAVPPTGTQAWDAVTQTAQTVGDSVGSSRLLLTGALQVDLEQIDTIEIVAEVVSASGKLIDDPARGRGVLAKRSGRWPLTPDSDGKLEYMRKRAVFGFDVMPDGRVILIREKLTLLRIQNLPDPRTAPLKERSASKDILPVFGDTYGRLTEIDLGVVHAAALLGVPVEIPFATDGAPSDEIGKNLRRKITVTRPQEINDTRARVVCLRAIGVSRTGRSFETAPRFSDGGEEHVLHRRQPLKVADQSIASDWTAAVVSRATSRPPAPAAKAPNLYFIVDRYALGDTGGATYFVERKCGIRLRFERGMFASGEGERIGVVLWPPGFRNLLPSDAEANTIFYNGRSMTLSDFQDADLGDAGPFISRWGGDPIREDAMPQKGWFLPPSAFAYFSEVAGAQPLPHDPMYVERAWMPIIPDPVENNGAADAPPPPASDAPSDILSFQKVSLLTFEPYFDIDSEEWFVEVGLDCSRATDPFVRLGLVRYQPHAIAASSDATQATDQRSSKPVRVWAQLLPQRKLKVSPAMTPKGLQVTAIVCGQASIGIKDLPKGGDKLLSDKDDGAKNSEVWQKLQRPLMKMTVFFEPDVGSGGRRQFEVANCEASSILDGTLRDGQSTWRLDLTIPSDRMNDLGKGRYVALVEEIELRLPATYSTEPIELKGIFKDVAESGPRFSARVPFWPSQ